MRGSSGLLLIVACLLFSLVPASSRADAGDEAARVHFQSGTRYFDRGEYEAAIREFSAAHELSGRPQLLYNLYLAHERLGQYPEAAETLAGYLEQVEEIESRERLELRLENLRRRVAAMEREREADAPGAEISLEPAPEPQRGMPLPALISFGVAGAGLVTFGVAGGLAISEDRALAGLCGADAGQACTDAQLAKLNRRTTVADLGLAVTAAGVAAGLVLYFVLRDRDAPSSTSRLRVTPGGLSLAF
jgi:tetratricopeptide (TPR) repeat protein